MSGSTTNDLESLKVNFINNLDGFHNHVHGSTNSSAKRKDSLSTMAKQENYLVLAKSVGRCFYLYFNIMKLGNLKLGSSDVVLYISKFVGFWQ